MRRHFLTLAAIALLAAIACKKSEAPPPLPPMNVAPKPGGNPAASEPATGAAPAEQVSLAKELDAKGITSDQEEQNRAALNMALRAWLMMKPDAPKDLNELVAAKLISRVPPPPPGKKWVADARTMSVTAK